jgi:hypothetical protein
MTTEHDEAMRKIIENKLDAETILCLDYIARRAAKEVIAAHVDSCPFKVEVQNGIIKYALIGLASVGSLLIAVGAILYGAWKGHNGQP